MAMVKSFVTSLACWVISNGGLLYAEIRPQGLFSDNAVLQREVRLPVWGTTDKTDRVTVSFAGQEVSAEPHDGKWQVVLAPLDANKKPSTLTITQGDSKVELKNILVGDVWVCGGQSNMERQLIASKDGKEAVANASNDQLRLLTIFLAMARHNLGRMWIPSGGYRARKVPSFSRQLVIISERICKSH